MSLRPGLSERWGTEGELFAEVFHQVNDIVLCKSSPIYVLQPLAAGAK